MSIELRLTEVEPPTVEPPRTVYVNIADAPDPLWIGFGLYMYNYDNITLYMQVEASGVGWTFSPNPDNRGSVSAGGVLKWVLHNWGSRGRPAAERFELIEITLRAYSDAGYSVLEHTYVKQVFVIYIDSADGTWNVADLDNFDDGTVEGWSCTASGGTIGNDPAHPVVPYIQESFVLSTPYGIRFEASRFYFPVIPQAEVRGLSIQSGGQSIVSFGVYKEMGSNGWNNPPRDYWLKLMVPLEPGATVPITIEAYFEYYAAGWFDDHMTLQCNKSFVIPDYPEVYGIFPVRLDYRQRVPVPTNYHIYGIIDIDDILIIYR